MKGPWLIVWVFVALIIAGLVGIPLFEYMRLH